MKGRYIVELTQEERDQLERLASGGGALARDIKRAQTLLSADKDMVAKTEARRREQQLCLSHVRPRTMSERRLHG